MVEPLGIVRGSTAAIARKVGDSGVDTLGETPAYDDIGRILWGGGPYHQRSVTPVQIFFA
jgi:hypothetical protein